jgi:GTP-binding protein HflX
VARLGTGERIDLVVDRDHGLIGRADAVAISATTGEGINDLLAAIKRQVQELLAPVRALVPYAESGLVQDCYDFGRVHSVDYQEGGILVVADLVAEMREKLARYAVTEA